MAFDMNRDALAYFISHIGCMPYTVYRIHDTTQPFVQSIVHHSFINSFNKSFNKSFNQLFFLYYSSSVVVLLFIHQSINHQSLVTSYFTYHYQLIYQLNYHWFILYTSEALIDFLRRSKYFIRLFILWSL